MSDRSSRGVSTVVATVLLVAIVLVISVGVFSLGADVASDVQDPPPQASFEFTQNGNALTITHQAGDAIDASQLTIESDGTSETWADRTGDTGKIRAGESAALTVSGQQDVKLVWTGEESDSSHVVAERTVDAPAMASFSGTNHGTNNEWGNQALRNTDGVSDVSGHFRVVGQSPKNVQVREPSGGTEVVREATAISVQSDATYDFELQYNSDAGEFTYTVTRGGDTATIGTFDEFGMDDAAVAVMAKARDDAVDDVTVSGVTVNGASVGATDGLTVSSGGTEIASLVLSGGQLDSDFTLRGEFTVAFDPDEVTSDEFFSVRIDVA
jgi:FlaG/FlaF family flagellin (archaellin)